MNLERKIHDFLCFSVGGNAKDVKGVSGVTMTQLKKGDSGISTRKLASVLVQNNIKGEIFLCNENGVNVVIEFKDEQI